MSWCAHCIQVQTRSLRLHCHCRGGAEMDSGEGLWTPLDKWPCGCQPAHWAFQLKQLHPKNLKLAIDKARTLFFSPANMWYTQLDLTRCALQQPERHLTRKSKIYWTAKKILGEHIGKSTISHESYLVISHYRMEPNARLIPSKIIALRMLRKLHDNDSCICRRRALCIR